MNRTRAALLVAATAIAAMFAATAIAQQRIVQWTSGTNTNPSDNQLALGYPVPMPVDTPLPFDGFRSYAGLHARHQDLAATTPLVHPHAIGTTRAGRSIWAYRIGDADTTTAYGLPESAMLINGGIHAREWQSPEVVTGLMELLAANAGDRGFHRYLLDNVNTVLIPVLNVDGYLQTQRYPADSWLGTDPDDPLSSPRDGRMRRKNMFNVDEVMTTQDDHLRGIDLNRNSPPFWAGSPADSSPDSRSIVYRGASPSSEPESQALLAAAALGPAAQLRLYADVHSFGRVLLWPRTANQRQTRITERLFAGFAGHHLALPGGRRYAYPQASQLAQNVGIGATSELFAYTFQVPSWTLELEPPGDSRYHASEPLCGANYGGVAENCHDGFILPESQIRRVRENMAQTLAGLFYRQSTPPSVTATRIFDRATGALVYESQWEATSDTARRQIVHQVQPLQLDRDYVLSHSYDKPMRWRNAAGAQAAYPGVPAIATQSEDSALVGAAAVTLTRGGQRWPGDPGGAPDGYARYRDDTTSVDLRLPRNAANLAAIGDLSELNLRHGDSDLTGEDLDANPATVARWQQGAWAGYEDTNGADDTDTGGIDATVRVQVSDLNLGEPFVLVPGSSSAWYDTARSGEGFMLEILSADTALAYFFTYDADGEQDWYTMVGTIRGNRIVFPEVTRTSGGVFGPGFNPANVTRSTVGSATFAFASCESGWMEWEIGGQRGRMQLSRLTRLLGTGCGTSAAVNGAGAGWSGSWYDPTHSGEGYVLEMIEGGSALVYWFSYDAQGRRRWFFGVGNLVDGDLRFQLSTTRGPRFGTGYDPADLAVSGWGALTLDLACGGGRAQYESALPGFGTGSLQLARLTRIGGVDCVD
jgi:hypothetical protein